MALMTVAVPALSALACWLALEVAALPHCGARAKETVATVPLGAPAMALFASPPR